MIFLDQPVGTGFSDTTDKRDYVRHEDRVGQDGLTFLLEFMEIHPELHGKELFLAGVSYAGEPTFSFISCLIRQGSTHSCF